MIKSIHDKKTKKIWQGKHSKKLPHEIQNKTRRKLRMINNAHNIKDLRVPPANHLEKLSGEFKDYYSIRINRQWRIIFIWKKSHAFEVQITDYH